MRGGKTLTREVRIGMDWRPLLASLCVHFAIAVGIGLILARPLTPLPAPSISLAQVTLQSPHMASSFFENNAGAAEEPTFSGAAPAFPSEDESPVTAAAASLAALERDGPTQSGAGGARTAASSSIQNTTKNQTPGGRGFLGGEGGNSAADERLMEKDIERHLASQPPSGPSAEISLFGGKLTGHSFAFVIDRSASTSSKHYATCAEIERQCVLAIDKLPAENRFQVVLYNDRVSITNSLRMATKKEKEAAKERMIRFSPSGGTMHLDALRAALLLRANVVCWFSDGGDPWLTGREVDELVLLAARSKTAIHAWRLGKRPVNAADDFMRVLAERTGGEFREGIPASQ